MSDRSHAVTALAESQSVQVAMQLAREVAARLAPTQPPEGLRALAQGLLHEAINLVE